MSPDRPDLFDLSSPVVREVYGHFQALVTELIADQIRRSGINARPDELARTLIYGLRGLRTTAADGADIRRPITVLVDIVMRAIAPA